MKHTMTRAAAKRIAVALLEIDNPAGGFRSLDSEAWRRALSAEGFRGYTAMHASSVLRELRNAELDSTADGLARRSFDALMSEVMDLRESATNLVNAFGQLGRARL